MQKPKPEVVNNPNRLNLRSLREALEDIFELHRDQRNKDINPRRVVRAFLDTITKALQNGEKVHLEGIGNLIVRTIAPRRMFVPVYKYHTTKIVGRRWITVPAKKRVVFVPSDLLLKELNTNQESE